MRDSKPIARPQGRSPTFLWSCNQIPLLAIGVILDVDTGRLAAAQLSTRGGMIRCELQGERVTLAGRAVTVMEAELLL